MTPHNSAEKGAFASTVLMPGDPLRAKFIADNFLTDVKQFNATRNMLGFTGYYNGKRVSVMGTGMGCPSIGIYSYELFRFYDVDSIIRVGSAGAIDEKLKVRDIVLALGACTDSRFAGQFRLPGTFAPIASYRLLHAAAKAAEKAGIRPHIGNILSSDLFYDDSASTLEWKKMGVLAVEMESAALYMNAARAGKEALTILTISDHLVTGEETTAEERERTFTKMMELALEIS